ncbi:serine protease inhibitor 3/4-like isoform X3 [Photinus pyralis]|uniref:serine protease inhibitor 3/4-like isoform X3 n=1 Tax=Photinus pyralis TaxID=7054 RepID=UPI001267572E|nr:serine protease inhibitor 3/4-like isoform X3 [Photinus pyralis]
MASKELCEVVSGNSRFANKFYNFIAEEEKGKNVFFSPISAHTVLAMAYQGAAGKTAESFASTLHVSDQDSASTGYSDVMKSLNSVEDVMLHIANKIYVMDGFPLKEKFHKRAKDHFLSEAESVNFAQSAESAKKINGWVEDKTNSKIKDLIKPSVLDQLTRLVLVNAIYFKGNWAHPFRKEATIKEKFYISETESVDCDMMHITKHFNYRDDEKLDAQVLEMKYSNKDVSMVFILPHKRTGIEELEKKLVDVDLSNITDGMRSMEVEVSLPKFKIETEMDLKSVLTKMGLGVIFEPGKADFSEVSESDEPLYVSKVIQKAFIEVNEEGAEAAAATAVVMLTRCAMVSIPREKIVFNVDHAFTVLLQVRNEGARHVLFYGRIASPKC